MLRNGPPFRRLSKSEQRDEADRARAILLTLEGRRAEDIAAVLGVHVSTVRNWRGYFAHGGVASWAAPEARTAGTSDPAYPVKKPTRSLEDRLHDGLGDGRRQLAPGGLVPEVAAVLDDDRDRHLRASAPARRRRTRRAVACRRSSRRFPSCRRRRRRRSPLTCPSRCSRR